MNNLSDGELNEPNHRIHQAISSGHLLGIVYLVGFGGYFMFGYMYAFNSQNGSDIHCHLYRFSTYWTESDLG
jgi:hypothetical protein